MPKLSTFLTFNNQAEAAWQITPQVLSDFIGDPDAVKAGRAMQAMLQMTKLDIAALKRAHDGDRA